MSVRRQTANRLTLFRTCGTCGKQIVTTADTPWVRQVERDGKRQATTYFCSEGCFAASYKHIGWFDGKAEERRDRADGGRAGVTAGCGVVEGMAHSGLLVAGEGLVGTVEAAGTPGTGSTPGSAS